MENITLDAIWNELVALRKEVRQMRTVPRVLQEEVPAQEKARINSILAEMNEGKERRFADIVAEDERRV
jgi:hypothetical protein